MAEEESEMVGGDGTAGIVWSELPKDVRLKVLSHLGIQDLCRMRCVCREWCDVIHHRDFRGMYDMANSSQEPRPVMCYLESSYPLRLEWTAYDYEGKLWKKMNSFPSISHSCLTTLNARVQNFSSLNVGLYSVGGLLCLLRWHYLQVIETGRAPSPCRVISSWTVWNPFRNRWKKLLPPCKHKVSDIASSFVHVFVSDERTKAYKILMAHGVASHPNHSFHAGEQKLVTEIYDSRTGTWTDGAEHTLKAKLSYRRPFVRGVLCNGVIYFATERYETHQINRFSRPSVLLSYDINKDEWLEETLDSFLLLFEWDGRLMALNVDNAADGSTEQKFLEWDLVRRMWKDTCMSMPLKIGKAFRYDLEGFSIVASGNHLAVTGLTMDVTEFRIAVYKRAENYWRMPPTATFSDKLRPARVEGLVLHRPSLDWRP
ncbi:hypothetical protein M758_10G073600 [Ceratodon purpureus]|nr:hypothetical protein M758_10G073600 [Ceratodon purpureus]